MRDRVQKDFFGFNCSVEYLLDEKALMNMHSNLTNQRDLEWVVYLKSIGALNRHVFYLRCSDNFVFLM